MSNFQLPVSTKNLEYLSEMMNQEALAAKKAQQYSRLFQEPELKTMCCDLHDHHKARFDAAYQYLNQNQ